MFGGFEIFAETDLEYRNGDKQEIPEGSWRPPLNDLYRFHVRLIFSLFSLPLTNLCKLRNIPPVLFKQIGLVYMKFEI
ncbi:hypothetical protein CI610_03555 [invertebrate metagenome]|uniref:Uncharacterized protein n=1 Tax=invertebrate metagenome TaxID=1711999 RepID=A0A2H9T2R3_9ZZZZ